MKLIPKDWNELQQYKDRKPLWIKFHRDLLNDFAYSSVQIGTKATLPLLWLLACEYEDGIIEATIEEISFRIHIDIKTLDKAISELVECKFFTIKEYCTEPYKNVPREETEKRREEIEIETILENEFQACWKNYTLTFLKSQGRGGGTKSKALIKYKGLRKKYSLEQIENLVNSEMNKNMGHRDLERVLTIDNMKQVLEDGAIKKVVPQQQLSFKQQDEIRAKEKSDNITRLLDNGFDPFSQNDWDKLSKYESQIMQEHQQGVIDVQPTHRIS